MVAAYRLPALLLLLLLPALAIGQAEPPQASGNNDPFERFNRKVFAFNDGTDRLLIRPVARGWERVTSPEVRTVVGNFFGNLRMPLSAAHALLQGKPQVAGRNLQRFGINTTVGLLGLFDPASTFGVLGQQEDMGQTLAVWGMPEGPYLVLPFIGPSSGRDALGGTVETFTDPAAVYARSQGDYRPILLELINLRTQFFQTERYIQDAYDPYTFVRDAFRQRRLYAIHDGEPPPELLEQFLMPEDDPADLLLDD